VNHSKEVALPKISASSVPEHRSQQRIKIKSAALEILIATGPKSLNHGSVAKAIGLTRPAIYEYFPSSNGLLEEILIDAFEESQRAIDSATSGHADPQIRLLNYIECVLALASAGLHKPATAIANWPLSQDFQVVLKNWHQRQIQPLISALTELGVNNPARMILIGGLIESAVKAIESGFPAKQFAEPLKELILGQVCEPLPGFE
jgi:AcrR family transcriptional regulator